MKILNTKSMKKVKEIKKDFKNLVGVKTPLTIKKYFVDILKIDSVTMELYKNIYGIDLESFIDQENQ